MRGWGNAPIEVAHGARGRGAEEGKKLCGLEWGKDDCGEVSQLKCLLGVSEVLAGKVLNI